MDPAFEAVSIGQMIEVPKRADQRGDLYFAQVSDHIPFVVNRVFFIMNVPEGVQRGGHAHKQAEQFLIALRGSAEISLNDGVKTQTVTLADPGQALYVRAKTWLDLRALSADCILLVLTSHTYDEADYLRNYEEYMTYVS